MNSSSTRSRMKTPESVTDRESLPSIKSVIVPATVKAAATTSRAAAMT